MPLGMDKNKAQAFATVIAKWKHSRGKQEICAEGPADGDSHGIIRDVASSSATGNLEKERYFCESWNK